MTEKQTCERCERLAEALRGVVRDYESWSGAWLSKQTWSLIKGAALTDTPEPKGDRRIGAQIPTDGDRWPSGWPKDGG